MPTASLAHALLSAALLAGCVDYLDRNVGAGVGDASTDRASTSTYAAVVLADAPVLYYRFDETTGATAKDAMGHTDATYPVAGVALGVAGALANDADTAVHLDGPRGISVPASVDFVGNAPYSVELWAKLDTSTDLAFLADHESATGARNGWDLVLNSGSSIVSERWQKDQVTAASSPNDAIGPQQWHYFVTVYDGSELTTWVDASLVGQVAATDAIGGVPEGWMVGAQNCRPTPCTTAYWVGALDELAIYDHVLDRERITAHFQAAH